MAVGGGAVDLQFEEGVLNSIDNNVRLTGLMLTSNPTLDILYNPRNSNISVFNLIFGRRNDAIFTSITCLSEFGTRNSLSYA